jgi:hypothetical protein
MHSAILRRLREEPATQLSRIASNSASIICGFDDHTPHPVWVAKIAAGPGPVESQRREHRALRHLAPWARDLSIPEVLEWQDTGDEAVLVVTGLPGTRPPLYMSLHATASELRRRFHAPLQWLRQFQRQVTLPHHTSLSEIVREYIQRLGEHPEVGDTLHDLVEILSSPVADPGPVPVHGDFQPTNLLVSHQRLSVIDWSAFSPGFPFQDAFSILVNSDYFSPGRFCNLVEAYHHVFFSDSPACRLMQQEIETEVSSPAEARFLFYCFLSTQICFNTTTPRQYWHRIATHLARHGWPGPGTLLPAP